MPQLNTDPLEFETDEYNKEIADAKARYLRVHGPVGYKNGERTVEWMEVIPESSVFHNKISLNRHVVDLAVKMHTYGPPKKSYAEGKFKFVGSP